MLAYTKRRGGGDVGETTWRIEADALTMQEPKGFSRKAYWTDIVALSLSAAPLKLRPWRHLTTVTQRNGARWEIDNAHFVSAGTYEDRSADYAPFVRAMVAKVGEKAPYARVRSVSSLVGFWAVVAVMGVFLAALALLVLAIPIPGVPGAFFLKLLLLAFFAPAVWMWFMEALPRGVRVADLPESAFPRVG